MGAPVTLVDPGGNYVELVDMGAVPGGVATEDTLSDLLASIGSPDDTAWNGSDAEASVISLLKAIALNTTTGD